MNLRHPQLQTYYQSVAMNMASIGTVLSILMCVYSDFNILAALSMILFFAFMAGYTLWFWIGKQKQVNTCAWLSDVSFYYTLYFLIVLAMPAKSQWWFIFALVSAIAALLIYIVKAPKA
jgi:hypothetical protein